MLYIFSRNDIWKREKNEIQLQQPKSIPVHLGGTYIWRDHTNESLAWSRSGCKMIKLRVILSFYSLKEISREIHVCGDWISMLIEFRCSFANWIGIDRWFCMIETLYFLIQLLEIFYKLQMENDCVFSSFTLYAVWLVFSVFLFLVSNI